MMRSTSRISWCLLAASLTVLLGAASHGLAQGLVSGLVFETRGDGFRPIPHARVEALSNDSVVAQVQADAFGHYVLSGLPAGEVIVTVAHPRYYPVRRADGESGHPVRCPSAGSCGELDFEMIASGEIEVTVTDSGGERLDDVRVTIRALDEPDRALGWNLKQHGMHGFFRSSTIRPGRYRVRAEPIKLRSDGTYHPVEAEVDFAYGQASEVVRLVMPFTRTYRIAGTIDGLLSWNALHLLVVLRPEAEDQGHAEAKRIGAALDENGAFALNGVPAGAYSMYLAPVEGTALNARSPEVLLGAVRVEGDVAGLAFALPDSIDRNERPR